MNAGTRDAKDFVMLSPEHRPISFRASAARGSVAKRQADRGKSLLQAYHGYVRYQT
jgi:hypothetical protein